MAKQGAESNIAAVLATLYPPRGGAARAQAVALTEATYAGDTFAFWLDFLLPAHQLLLRLQQGARAQYFRYSPGQKGWPLTFGGRIVVHLAPPNPKLLQPGDFYLLVLPAPPQSNCHLPVPKAPRVVVRWLGDTRLLQELTLPEHEFPRIFAPGWICRLNKAAAHGSGYRLSPSVFPGPLSNILLASETGLCRLPWEKLVRPAFIDIDWSRQRTCGTTDCKGIPSPNPLDGTIDWRGGERTEKVGKTSSQGPVAIRGLGALPAVPSPKVENDIDAGDYVELLALSANSDLTNHEWPWQNGNRQRNLEAHRLYRKSYVEALRNPMLFDDDDDDAWLKADIAQGDSSLDGQVMETHSFQSNEESHVSLHCNRLEPVMVVASCQEDKAAFENGGLQNDPIIDVSFDVEPSEKHTDINKDALVIEGESPGTFKWLGTRTLHTIEESHYSEEESSTEDLLKKTQTSDEEVSNSNFVKIVQEDDNLGDVQLHLHCEQTASGNNEGGGLPLEVPRGEKSGSENPSVVVKQVAPHINAPCPAHLTPAPHVNEELLRSGIVCLPGSRDRAGHAVVFIDAGTSTWTKVTPAATALTDLLIYFYSILSTDVREQGLAIVVDARKAGPSELLSKAIADFQIRIPGSVHSTLLLVEKEFAVKMERSCIPQYEVMPTLRSLHKRVDAKQLPSTFDGSLPYHHDAWLCCIQKLQALKSACKEALSVLQSAMTNIKESPKPLSVEDAWLQDRQLRGTMGQVLADTRLCDLQRDGGALLARVKRSPAIVSLDCRAALDTVTKMFEQVEEKVHDLVRASNQRLQTLQELGSKSNMLKDSSCGPVHELTDKTDSQVLPASDNHQIHLPHVSSSHSANVSLKSEQSTSSLSPTIASVPCSPATSWFKDSRAGACQPLTPNGVNSSRIELQDALPLCRPGNTGVYIKGLEVGVTTANSGGTGVVLPPANHPNLGISQSLPPNGNTKSRNSGKLDHLFSELLSTERKYIRALTYVIRHYLPQLEKPSLPSVLQSQKDTLFSCLPALAGFHGGSLLPDLEACQTRPQLIGRCFLKHKKSFQMYTEYMKNKPQSDALMASHGNEFFKKKQTELGDKMELASYLVKPIQRLSKYAVLLKDMIRECRREPASSIEESVGSRSPGGAVVIRGAPLEIGATRAIAVPWPSRSLSDGGVNGEGDTTGGRSAVQGNGRQNRVCSSQASEQELKDMEDALELLRFHLRHGNDLLAMEALRNCSIRLQDQGDLLRQDEFLIWNGRRRGTRRVFLFRHLVLFSKPSRSSTGPESFIYKHSYKMADIGLTESVGDSGLCFELWGPKRRQGDIVILQAPSTTVKRAWTRDIANILWEQAESNRELRRTEMLCLGVGTKPLLDLQPEEPTAGDHRVNCTSTDRGLPLVRSQSEPQAQRPCSTVSSSSSSSSSNSSPGGRVLGSPRATTGLLSHLGANSNVSASIDELDELECDSESLPSVATESSGSSSQPSGGSGQDSGIVGSCTSLLPGTTSPTHLPSSPAVTEPLGSQDCPDCPGNPTSPVATFVAYESVPLTHRVYP
uniref:puratrophin-1-like isoform X2 n=1 Tax=Myxine glutinosa TaxID=7769 RepID=UPI003590185A